MNQRARLQWASSSIFPSLLLCSCAPSLLWLVQIQISPNPAHWLVQILISLLDSNPAHCWSFQALDGFILSSYFSRPDVTQLVKLSLLQFSLLLSHFHLFWQFCSRITIPLLVSTTRLAPLSFPRSSCDTSTMLFTKNPHNIGNMLSPWSALFRIQALTLSSLSLSLWKKDQFISSLQSSNALQC